MKKLFLIIVVATLIISCKSKDKPFDTKNYESSKENLAENEIDSPQKFLVVSSKDKHNLIGQTVVKGSIKNTAKVVTFKDVELKFTYFSKTGVQVDENLEVFYEVIEPNHEIKFKSKYFAAKGADSVDIKVIKATGVSNK